ncbi:MAG: hypothetical protein ACI86M_003879 [Saprospiraceae bacterium]|jgi:hypothetical protein
MTDLNTILKEQFSFDDNLIDELYKRLIHKTYKKGEHFLEIGTKPRNFGFMEYGCFMYNQMKDGIETAIDFTFENSWNTDLASINAFHDKT